MKVKALLISTLLVALTFASCMHKPFTLPAGNSVADDCTGPVPTFKTDIQPILHKACAKSGCHDGIGMPRDFSFYDNIVPELSDSSLYYYVIIDRTMPQDTALDSTQYHLMKCWLNNGHPND